MARREYTPPPPTDDAALAIGIVARELRCDLGLWPQDLAREHGWTGVQWLEAEAGRRGVPAARQVLQWTRARAAEIEAARAELLAELQAAVETVNQFADVVGAEAA